MIPFLKMHGAGNHFVVLDALHDPHLLDLDGGALALRCCRHRLAVGADGLLLLAPPPPGETGVSMRMWNPDGTEDMCGNGLRCVARLAFDRHGGSDPLRIWTRAGWRLAWRDGAAGVRITMGEPVFDFPGLPFAPATLVRAPALNYCLPVRDLCLEQVCSLSTGSTHTVIFSPPPALIRWDELSQAIENHPWFPQRTSVLWTTATDDSLSVRIWERGVGETLACGTGACAVAVAAILTGRAASPVAVKSGGGTLRVEWQPGEEMILSGPTAMVYSGTLSP